MPVETIVPGTDGCSLPTFRSSRARSRPPTPHSPRRYGFRSATGSSAAALDRLRAAMIAHPENVAGHGQLVTNLMALNDGRIAAKGGAEGFSA